MQLDYSWSSQSLSRAALCSINYLAIANHGDPTEYWYRHLLSSLQYTFRPTRIIMIWWASRRCNLNKMTIFPHAIWPTPVHSDLSAWLSWTKRNMLIMYIPEVAMDWRQPTCLTAITWQKKWTLRINLASINSQRMLYRWLYNVKFVISQFCLSAKQISREIDSQSYLISPAWEMKSKNHALMMRFSRCCQTPGGIFRPLVCSQ